MAANPMGYINEYATRCGLKITDEYSQTGPPHNRTFVCTLKVGDKSAQGEGKSKKEAKAKAAENLRAILSSDEEAPSPSVPSTPSIASSSASSASLDSTSPVQQSSSANMNSSINKFTEEYSHTGPPHNRTFVCTLKVGDKSAQGEGKSKKEAKAKATENLRSLDEELPSPSTPPTPSTPSTSSTASTSSIASSSPIQQQSSSANKSSLNQFCQQNCLPIPKYEIIDKTGQAHELVFTVCCTVRNDKGIVGEGTGVGKSIKIAENEAASVVLEKLLPFQFSRIFPIIETSTIPRPSVPKEPSSTESPTESVTSESVSVKNHLQELCQKNSLKVPEYTLKSRAGSANAPWFTVLCKIYDSNDELIQQSYGNAASRKAADIDAAKKLIPKIRALINSMGGATGNFPPMATNLEQSVEHIALVDQVQVDDIVAQLVGNDFTIPEFICKTTDPADPHNESTVLHLSLAYSYYKPDHNQVPPSHYDLVTLPVVGHGKAGTQDEAKFDALINLYHTTQELLPKQC